MSTKVDLSKLYERNILVWGEETQKDLFNKHVVVFGLGGVGSFAAESIARAGIGRMTVIDFDTVSESNINRQLLATVPDVGKSKAVLMKDRIYNINPEIKVIAIDDFYREDLNEVVFAEKADFVIDAIDTLKFKIDLIDYCVKNNIPIISSFGAGNRLDPTKLYITDLSEVRPGNCSFLKNVKHRLKQRGITKDLPVVTSSEKSVVNPKIETVSEIETASGENISLRKFTPGSSPFVPPVAGYFMSSYVVRSFIGAK